MEIWKDIKGFEGSYQVSDFGNFRSLDRLILRSEKKTLIKGNVMKTWANGSGYLQVTLCKEGVRKHLIAHRVVAQEFICNTERKPQVNHIDGNRTNNHVDNLEWCTNGENQIHRYQVLGGKPWNKGKKMNIKNKIEKNKRKVILNDIEYNSILECMNKTGRSTTYIYKYGTFN